MEQNTGLMTVTRFDDPSHTGYLNNLENELKEHVSLEGQHHGEQNKPTTEPEFRALILNFIQTRIQDALEQNQRKFLPVSGMVVAKQIEEDAKTKVAALLNERRDGEHTLKALEKEAELLKPALRPSRLRMWAMVALGLIAVTDGILSYRGFRFASFPIIGAVLASAGVAVGIGLGAHYLGGYVKKAQTAWQRRVRYAVALVPYAIGFYGLAILRANAYNYTPQYAGHSNVAAPQSNEVTAWSIALVSFLLYWLGVFISTRFYKTKEELAREQAYEDKCAEVQKVRDGIGAIDAAIRNVQMTANAEAGVALAKYEFALSCECKLRSYAKRLAEEYKAKNLRYRRDGKCPDFFSQIPEFQFTTFFNNSTPQTYENA